MAQKYWVTWTHYDKNGKATSSGSHESTSSFSGIVWDRDGEGYTRYSPSPISEPDPKPDPDTGTEPDPKPSTGGSGSSGGSTYKPPKPTNQPPKIDGKDGDLGGKNKAFDVPYIITDPDSAEVKVDISIDDKVVETIQNVQKNTTLTFTVTDEMLRSYPMEETKHLIITATDDKNAKAYRNYTFRRTNAPPKITLEHTIADLEKVKDAFTVTYVATDEENDQLQGQVLIDGVGTDLAPIAQGERNDYQVTHDMITKLTPGQHWVTVRVVDDKNQSTSEQFQFTRIAPRIVVRLDPPVATTLLAKKIQVLLTKIDGGPDVTTRVEVCNNANDPNPTWEDITEIVESGGIHEYVNKTAEADTAIDIRIVITSNGTNKETQLLGFSGGFE